MRTLRGQTSTLALLASAALFSFPSAAQPAPALASQAEREIAITGAADEPPATVYGAPNVSIMVSFDSPPKKDGLVVPQGAEVRPHPFVSNAIVITPSSSLTAETPILVSVPLLDGTAVLKLTFSPPKRDTSVRIVRRATSSGRPALTGGEQKELLLLAAERALEPGTCAGATAAPRRVDQGKGDESSGEPLVCGGGSFAYLRVKVRGAACAPATARLTRGGESAEVLVLAPHTTAPCPSGNCWLLVARAPVGDGRGFTLEVLAEDGAPCLSSLVNLKPNSP